MMRVIALALTMIWLGANTVLAGTITINGQPRSYILDRPAVPQGPAPLIVALHGRGGDAAQFKRYSRFSETANPRGLAVVYPEGLANRWNDGRVNARGQLIHDVDDVTFLSRLIAVLVRQGIADPSRVVFTGISNGGMMSFRMACETRLPISGIAPVAANIPVPLNCQEARTKLLHIMGTDDPLVPYDGGYVGSVPQRGEVISAAETLGIFSKANRCMGSTQLPLPNSADDGMNSLLVSGEQCSFDTSQIRVNGGGHTWPGAAYPLSPALGAMTRDFSASNFVVRFASGERLN
jgi:polyhydroxybutyrate depolymerase